MWLAAYDPHPDDAFAAAHGVTFMPLGELLATADVLSLHAPAEQIEGVLIGAAELRRVKPSAFLINTARGALVDEAALAAALREGRLAGAGIDAFVTNAHRQSAPNWTTWC
jgi:D-3-phosphoglycerate dehydrogenase